jgi:hypothetical protein
LLPFKNFGKDFMENLLVIKIHLPTTLSTTSSMTEMTTTSSMTEMTTPTPTDWRALCAELADALHGHTSLYEGHECKLVARARARLAQPVPEVVGATMPAAIRDMPEQQQRWYALGWQAARAALTQPEPQGLPTDYIDAEHTGHDRELLETFYVACRSEGGTADEIHLRGLKAVLALAQPEPQGPTDSLFSGEH